MVFVLLFGPGISRGGIWINEVMFNPPGTNDIPNQYIELRGTPNVLLTDVYFVAVEGDTNGNPGTIQNVFDLSKARIGGNGFLVLLQNSNTYHAVSGSAVYANTNGPGFGTSAGVVKHRGSGDRISLQPASTSYFLIQSSKAPKVDDDIDSNDDGIPDGDTFANWAVLDSVGVLDNDGSGDFAYGRINFRRLGPPGDQAVVTTGQIIPIDFTPGYIARLKNSTNGSPIEWTAGDKLGGTAPGWVLNKIATYPSSVAGMGLSSVGGPNFRAPRLPGIVLRESGLNTEVIEGGNPDRYTLALNSPALHGVTVRITTPPGVLVSVDRGRTFSTNRTITLSRLLPRTIMVRALDDESVGPDRQVQISHAVIATSDPVRYPVDSTIIPPLNVLVRDKQSVLLSEIKANPPGPDDAPFEFVELRGTPGALLDHVQFVSVIGDVEVDPGVARTVVNLAGARLGTNGLLLLVAPGHPYLPAPGTTVVEVPQFSRAEGALDNGCISFLLLYSTNDMVEGTDLDAGNNGTLEKLPPDTVVLDSIGWRDGGATDRVYTTATLRLDSSTPDAATRFATDNRPNTADAWFGGNLLGDAGSSLTYDKDKTTTNAPLSTPMSPGVTNNSAPQIHGLSAFSSVIGDPTTPALNFSISDAESPVSALSVSATSSDTNVVPNENLVIRGTGSQRTLRIIPQAIGYSTITVVVSDGAVTGTRSFDYAAAADARGHGRFHSGASDGSAAYAIDSRWMLMADDENQTIRLYSRSNSGPAVAGFDFNPYLALTDFYEDGRPKEVDLEGSTHVGNRIYWIGSHSHDGDADVRTNRGRIFATDISGSGTNITLRFQGQYQYLKSDLLNWDAHGEHGKGDFYYGLFDSSRPGVDPKDTNGVGFNIEGLAMAPNSTNAAYIGFRAPLIPPAERIKALIVVVTNFASLAVSDSHAGATRFGAPIELNLGGRGIRSIEGIGTNYLIVAGPPGPATGVPPSDFKLFTWSGQTNDEPQQRAADLTGMNPEGIVALPKLPWTSNSAVQLLSDNGTAIFYGDGVEAKHLPVRAFKQCRTDWVRLGPVVTPEPFIRSAAILHTSKVRIAWHSVKGLSYRVQTATSLFDSKWVDVSEEITAPDAITSESVDMTEGQRFFRVIVVPKR